VPDDRLQVVVAHGMVTLTGDVDWNYQKEAARAAAARISGVKSIYNAITVRPRASAGDVRERIMAAIKRSSALDAASIQVSVDGGTVKLRGNVHGWNERRIAENAAWAAPGVTTVEDEIMFA
jgi:osmotically-inducible protein OsmY